jgi:hypothetical protein
MEIVYYYFFSRNGGQVMKYWTKLGTAALVILGMAVPVAAQAQESEASGPHLPADSMEIGARYMEMILNYDAEDLHGNFTEELKENFGTPDVIMDRMMGLFDQLGSQEEVVSQRYWMRNGKPQFWHTAIFSEMDEPFVFRFVIEPDGKISGIGINPESQNPEVDDPDQHSDADEGADA